MLSPQVLYMTIPCHTIERAVKEKLTAPASVTLFQVQHLVSSRMELGAGPLVKQWMSIWLSLMIHP